MIMPPTSRLKSLSCTDSVPLSFGATYLMGARTENGTDVAVGFQCFRVEGTEKLLIAWRILRVWTPDEDEQNAPQLLPWWDPQAWQGIWRPAPDEGSA